MIVSATDMKTLKTLLSITILAFSLLAQSTADQLAGNSATLLWNPNPATDGVTAYAIYVNGAKTLVTPTNSVPLNSLLSVNGTYTLNVSASNVNGESPLSTNLVVRYWANKPTPPAGLNTK